jgi:hypothetical protein
MSKDIITRKQALKQMGGWRSGGCSVIIVI